MQALSQLSYGPEFGLSGSEPINIGHKLGSARAPRKGEVQMADRDELNVDLVLADHAYHDLSNIVFVFAKVGCVFDQVVIVVVLIDNSI